MPLRVLWAVGAVWMWALPAVAQDAGATSSPSQESPPPAPFQVDLATASWTACDPVNLPGCEVAVLYQDPATGASQFLLRSPPRDPREDLRKLLHPGTNEAQVMLQGTLRVLVGDEERILHPGSFLFIPAGTVHGARCVSDGGCVWYEYQDGPLDIVLVEVPLPEVPPDDVAVEPVPMDPEEGERLVGRYLTGTDTIEVSLASGRLRLETGFWKTYDLAPVQGGRWVMAVFEGEELVSIAGPRARFEFLYDGDAVRALRLRLVPDDRIEFDAERIR